jgi:lysophospholipase L1-like esterase
MERNAETLVPSLSLRKKLLFASAVTIASVLLGLIIVEATIRKTSKLGYVTPEIIKNRSLPYSPALFARHIFPEKEVRAYGEWGGPTQYYINKNGYRGHDFAVTKPEGVIRIMIYGGSAVFDPNQPEGQDWPHRIETILRQNGFPQVEVINAGIPGHASFDCFGRLFAEGHLFNPNYVIFYNGWNDIKTFRFDRPLLRQLHPYNDQEDPRVNYQGRLDRFLCEHSQLYVRLRGRYYNWELPIGSEGSVPEGDYLSDFKQTALQQYRINQQMFVDLAREVGAVPVLMTEARLATDSNTASQKSRIQYPYVKLTHQGLLKSYQAIEETLRQVSSEKGVDLIDLSGNMDGKDEFFSDHVHLTAQGSEELARITAQKLAALIGRSAPKKTSRQ